MHFTFTLALLAAVGLAKKDQKDLGDDTFEKFTSKRGKNYKSVDEYNKRKGNWEENHAIVQELNALNREGNVWFDDNDTSDMTEDEFKEMLGLNIPVGASSARLLESTADERRHLQSMNIDWVANGNMYPVKNQ